MSPTIKEWTKLFADLYYEKDKKRGPIEFWCTVVAHLSQVGEAIRRHDYETLLDSSVHAFEWMCSFVYYLNNTDNLIFQIDQSLSEVVGFKYPNRCGHCMKEVCDCDAKQIDSKKDKAAIYQTLLEFYEDIRFDRYTTTKWLKHLDTTFGNNTYLQSLETLGFHLLEEAGEEAQALIGLLQFQNVVADKIKGIDESFLKSLTSIEGLVKAYRTSGDALQASNKALKLLDFEIKENDKRPEVICMRLVKAKMGLIIELADTVSWLFSILIKYTTLNSDIRKKKYFIDYAFFEDEIIDVFDYKQEEKRPLACYLCGKRVCKCIYY